MVKLACILEESPKIPTTLQDIRDNKIELRHGGSKDDGFTVFYFKDKLGDTFKVSFTVEDLSPWVADEEIEYQLIKKIGKVRYCEVLFTGPNNTSLTNKYNSVEIYGKFLTCLYYVLSNLDVDVVAMNGAYDRQDIIYYKFVKRINDSGFYMKPVKLGVNITKHLLDKLKEPIKTELIKYVDSQDKLIFNEIRDFTNNKLELQSAKHIEKSVVDKIVSPPSRIDLKNNTIIIRIVKTAYLLEQNVLTINAEDVTVNILKLFESNDINSAIVSKNYEKSKVYLNKPDMSIYDSYDFSRSVIEDKLIDFLEANGLEAEYCIDRLKDFIDALIAQD